MLAKPAIFNQSVPSSPPPSENLGPELCPNGTFDDATGWVLDTGWSIGSGVMTSDGTNGFSWILIPGAKQDGTLYRVTFDITAETIAPVTYGLWMTFGRAINGINNYADLGVGSYSFDIICQANDTKLYFRVYPLNDWAGSIDNVSVKEIL